MSQEEPIKIALKLDGEVAKRFLAVKKKWGVEANTDVIRMLITWYYDQLPREEPALEHFNLNENGVQILDRKIGQIIQVYFKPDKILCEYDETNDCKHVQFALDLPEVQEILRKKGWKLK